MIQTKVNQIIENAGMSLRGFSADEPNPFDFRTHRGASNARVIRAARERSSVALASYTDEQLATEVAKVRVDRATVAADERMCVAFDVGSDKDRRGGRWGEVAVQHCSSGLLVRASTDAEHEFVSFVEARPYEHGLICHEHGATTEMWRCYRAIGIGQRIYRRVDQELTRRYSIVGQLRWPAGVLHPGSLHLRNSLHRSDPYKWETNDCAICLRNGIADWRSTPPGGFPAH